MLRRSHFNSFIEGKVITKEELFERLSGYEIFFNKETVSFLHDVINLKVSIFKNLDLNLRLCDLDIIKDIAIYNVLMRSKTLIYSIKELSKEKLECDFGNDWMNIRYKLKSGDLITIFNAYLKNPKTTSYLLEGRFIHIFKIDSSKVVEIQKERLEFLNKKKYRINTGSVYSDNEVRARFGDLLEVEKLKESIFKLQKNSAEIDAVTTAVSNALSLDWNMQLEVDEIKNLGWLKIKKCGNEES